MAVAWDELSEDQQKQLVAEQLKGSTQTPENENRARDALLNNPRLVDRLAKQIGITSADEVDGGDDEESEGIPDENLGIDDQAEDADINTKLDKIMSKLGLQ